jgi:hypothetical protein
MEKNNLRGVPHPPFSSDPAPSDFFLFGYIKAKLQGTKFTEKDDLLVEIHELLNGVSDRVLKMVFIEWERRLETWIDAGGEYAEQIIIYTISHFQPARRC